MADPIHIDLPGEFRLTVASETEQGAEVGVVTARDPAGACHVIPLPWMLDPEKMREIGWAFLCAGAFDPFGCCYEEGERPSALTPSNGHCIMSAVLARIADLKVVSCSLPRTPR